MTGLRPLLVVVDDEQGILDVVETHNGVRLPIDVNVAQLPSPSEDYATGE